MNRVGLVATGLVLVWLSMAGCTKLSELDRAQLGDTADSAKFADTIPLEYGNLIAATTFGQDQRWVTLWFEKADKTIVVVGVDRHTWRIWKEPRLIVRN